MEDDTTLGGYLRKHDRPPAFEGSDGSPYSVEVYVDDVPCEDGRFGAALLFVRWSANGETVAGHLETAYLEYGDTRDTAQTVLNGVTLHQLKEHLEQLIEKRKGIPDW